MALIPRRGLAQNVASLVTALGAGKYKREADKANEDYMQKYNAPEQVAQPAPRSAWRIACRSGTADCGARTGAEQDDS
jgi:hypothetical protein